MEQPIYEGKAKILYTTDDPQVLVQYFKDDATAFNAQKRGVIPDKGVYNNLISEKLFRLLESSGVPTHFVDRQDERRMRVRRLEMIALEVVVRNVVAGSLARRLGLTAGRLLDNPLVEFYYKQDALGDPLINEDHIALMGLATPEELKRIRALALKANAVLRASLDRCGIILVDCKFEFGRDAGGTIRLGDEVCPDTCRFWDKESGRILDKDRFRQDLGEVAEAYREVWNRVQGVVNGGQ